MSTNPEARAWLRVRADALRRNYARIEAGLGPGVRMIPMVKADAYGLGVAETVRALAPEGPLAWGVATVDEGARLRALGVEEPVIVFCPLPADSVSPAIAAGLDLSVSSEEGLEAVLAGARRSDVRPRVHIDVDTGMGRTGFDWRRAAEWLPMVAAAASEVAWVGIYTHLHSAEDDEASVREQWTRFEEVVARLPGGGAGLLVHGLNSAGAFRAPGLARSAVRPGIFLYGGGIGSALPAPEAVVSLHARVLHVREAAPGTTLGYGATYRAAGAERWATLGIGYADGYPRALGNRGHVLLGGRRVPVVGRISMDMTVVDITGVGGVRAGEVATLLGTDGSETITLDEVAGLAGTISYEILTGFSPRLPRIWTGLDGS